MRNFPEETPSDIFSALNDPNKGLLKKWKEGTIKGNPEGFDRYYYNSNEPLTHADIGDFKNPTNPSASLESGKMTGGGHGQTNIDYLEATGKQYNIEHTFDNGVRTGNVPTHDVAGKRTGVGQSWFPSSWTKQEIDLASKYVIQKNQSAYNELADGIAIYDIYKGVRVGIIKTDGKFATVFPDSEFQPNALGQLIKNPKY
ncbi:EndoU domain-containing protein [Flavobacterium columnare]|uniref:Bacterial EndoU nuclease domain-containing protein n=2 Tax=Flavobacterium columnare TaxID=996 RepID=A0AA94F4S7_9FLAO|nr:EndoU domain-containing protein [Flavobacterium columnare]MCH4830030.1 EndoU domain-containing protein [Flavobacterium columnare]